MSLAYCKWLRLTWVLALVGALVLAGEARTVSGAVQEAWEGEPITCQKDLDKFSKCELDQLFMSLDAGPLPVGKLRGRLHYMTDRCAKLKIRMANVVWRGKQAEEDGYFINRFLFGKALDSYAHHGPSWLDGKGCVVMEYPPQTKFFYNFHDELREICPGLYLGRAYDICPCKEFRAYFTLQVVECKKCCKWR